jgi:hypothetical protein
LVADAVGTISGKGVGTGSAVTIIFSGAALVAVALIMSRIKVIRTLEQGSENDISRHQEVA